MSARDPVLTASQQAVVDHPVLRPAVVDAGAGTGKTFTIVERVAALHERGICPADKILLLTFARKAAAELRGRIARRLDDVTPTCSTFHAFAWSVLADHAYDIGMSPETEVLEDVEARVEFKRAFDEYLADVAASPSGFPLRVYNRDEIRRQLFSIDQQLKRQGIAVDAFERNALAATDAFARMPYRELRKPLVRPRAGKDWTTILEVSDEGFAQDLAWERERIQACADILRRFAARLAARNALTYGDILVRAERAIREHAPLRERLRRRYRCCIVDEYQDTDLSQHRLLEAIFGQDLAAVMVVGDTLQSIFGFRGAQPENVEIFLRAPEAVRYALAENRRSRQEILDLAHDSIASTHAEARRLESQRGAAGEQIVHVSTMWEADGGGCPPIEVAREREAEAVACRIAALLASGQTVDAGQGPEPISGKHIAILSRTKRNVQPVTEALIAAGVPFKLVGGVGFYDAPEIRDTLAWMRLLANPFDSLAVARALQADPINAPDALVARLAQDLQSDETAFARRVLTEALPEGDELAALAAASALQLRELLDALAPHAAMPLAAALSGVIESTGIARSSARLAGPRGAQALANLAKLETLARTFVASLPAAQPADFVSFIEELETVDFDEREADVSGAQAVTISTIHAAKGLEWPFVFVLSVWPQLPNPSRLLLDERDGALLYGENPDGGRSFHYQSRKLGADAQGFVPRDQRKEQPEEARLFYVALTRARDRLFVSGPRTHAGKDNPSGRPGDHLARIYEAVRARGWLTDEPLPARENVAPPTPSDRAIERSSPKPPRVGADRAARLAWPLSYSLLARYDQCPRQAAYAAMLRLPELGGRPARRAPDRDGEEPSAVRAAPDSLLNAGEYGRALHRALELWANDRKGGMATRKPSEHLADALQALSLEPARDQRAQALAALERMEAQLGRWQPLFVEAPFTLDFGEEGRSLLVTGYIDLIALDEQGRPCLIDYKTGDVKADHALQLALYRRAAREVYGVDVARCLIGRVGQDAFSLVAIDPVGEAELRDRVRAVRDGLERGDDTAKPGEWCWSCGYRAAPCDEYPRSKARSKVTTV